MWGWSFAIARYRADGPKIGINQGIYGITNNDGKWGIQLSSIIFTPVNYINASYQDAADFPSGRPHASNGLELSRKRLWKWLGSDAQAKNFGEHCERL